MPRIYSNRILIYLISLTILGPLHWSYAQATTYFCQSLFASDSLEKLALDAQNAALKKISADKLSTERRNAEYVKLLTGDGNKIPDLRIEWKINKSEHVEEIDGVYVLHAEQKMKVHEINPFGPVLYQRVTRFLSSPNPDSRFFENIYKNYENRIRDELIKQVKRVEDALPPSRQSYGLVFANSMVLDQAVVGTIRVFDGTPRSLESTFSDYDKVSPELPLEAIFKARKIPTQFSQKLAKMRMEHPYTPIFELGKLSLENSADVRDRTMKAIDLFLYDYYLSRYPTAIFVVHVASTAHLKLYKKRYGFDVEESVQIPGTNQTEYILTLPAEKFRVTLKKRLGF